MTLSMKRRKKKMMMMILKTVFQMTGIQMKTRPLSQ